MPVDEFFEEGWMIDGVPLQTYAYNITTLGGSRMAPPPLRGTNVNVPFRPGSTWQPRIPDSRTITLAMWVIGANKDGSIPEDRDLKFKFRQNWRELTKLLWRPKRELILTKKIWIPETELVAANAPFVMYPEYQGYRQLTVSAKATFAGGLEPTMTGNARATFMVDLLLSDPYFYGDPITHEFDVEKKVVGGESTFVGRYSKNLHILGDDATSKILIEFHSNRGMLEPRFSWNDPNPTGAVLSYDPNPFLGIHGFFGPIAENEDGSITRPSAHIDIDRFAAYYPPESNEDYVSGAVYTSGNRFWMELDPAGMQMTFSVGDGAGTASITYRPAWL